MTRALVWPPVLPHACRNVKPDHGCDYDLQCPLGHTWLDSVTATAKRLDVAPLPVRSCAKSSGKKAVMLTTFQRYQSILQ